MSEEKEIDFMGIRKIAAAVSGILVLVSLILVFALMGIFFLSQYSFQSLFDNFYFLKDLILFFLMI